LHVLIVEAASILPTGRGVVGNEWSGGTEMESRILANESRVTEQPEQRGRALEAGPGIGDNPSPGRALEEYRAHQERRIGRHFARADEFNLKTRGLFGQHRLELIGFVDVIPPRPQFEQ